MQPMEDPPATGWTRSDRVMRWRDQSSRVDLAVMVIEGWMRHRSGASAALIAYYGFVSVFPLLAVMVTVLGWVLQGNEQLQADIVDSALVNLPIIGQQIALDPSAITGNAVVFVVGLATALWAGTRAFAQAQQAMDDIWDVPRDTRPNIAARRGRSLLAVVVVGASQIMSAAVVTIGFAGVVNTPALSAFALAVAAFAINLLTLVLVLQILSSGQLAWRPQVLPGALMAAVAFTILQFVGTAIVGRAISNASSVYGTFATVIALVSWLSLHATATLLGAELNAALHRRSRTTSA
jgi:membrane protein